MRFQCPDYGECRKRYRPTIPGRVGRFRVAAAPAPCFHDAFRHNTERPHQGRGMKGRTPVDVFVRCLPKSKRARDEKMKKAA